MELQIDEEKNIAYIKLSGLLSEKDILSAFDATVSSENYKKGMGRLWDLRDVNLSSLSPAGVDRMAQYPLKFSAGIDDVKVGIVATRPLEFGIARMAEGCSSDSKTKIHVFNDMEEAERWMIQ